MDKWDELIRVLRSENFVRDRGCEKIFNGPAAVIDGLEQLHIDRFSDHLFVLTYTEISTEVISRLVRNLTDIFPGYSIRIQLRQSGISHELYLSECIDETIEIEEAGLRYTVHSGRGQNTGFFPDMVNGRKAVADFVGSREDARVLNLFAYTCSFAVAALNAGAESVDNWDMNKNSLSIGRDNIRLNGLDERSSSYFAYDIFKSFSKIKRRGPYDLVIMDPPPLQGRSFSYKKDYPRLIGRIPQILAEEGAVLFCLNAPDCTSELFLEMINTSLSGKFKKISAVPCPPAYLGRFKERGLKTFLAEGYSQ